MTLTLRQWLSLGLLVAAIAAAGWLYWKGGHDQKVGSQAKTLKAEVKAVGKSNKISRKTQDRVESEGAGVRRQAQRDEDRIDEAAVANTPAADAVVVRVAREAYERAVRASCRVQRADGCDAAPAAPDTER